jgi:hypothetical protein
MRLKQFLFFIVLTLHSNRHEKVCEKHESVVEFFPIFDKGNIF